MTDQELFKLIKKAIREKKTIPPHSDNQTFAERYCEQQMAKKKFNHHSSHDKMDSLMKNFNKLQTYFDLPQLLNSISMLKTTKEKEIPHRCSRRLEVDIKNPIDQRSSWNKHLIEMRNLHFVVENEKLKSMMTEIQDSNPLKSQMLKNNSIYNMDIICDNFNNDKDKISKNSRLFELLKTFKEDEERFIHREVETENQESKINSKQKKDYNNFLHKVSSYLQIALEMEHRSKWKNFKQRRSTNLRKTLPNFIVLNKLVKHKAKKPQTSPLNQDMSNTNYVEVLKEETTKFRLKHNVNHAKGKGQSRFFMENQSKLKQQHNINQTFDEGDTINKSVRPSNIQIRQNFTFRRRGVKQRIINRLDKFIGDIDEESHSNQKENKYYSDEINKLQNQYRGLYSRYKRETLAGDRDMENLKKIASEFQFKTPPIHRGSIEQNKGMIMSQVSNAFNLDEETYF